MIVGILILAALICGFMFGFGLANYRQATRQLKMMERLARQEKFPTLPGDEWKNDSRGRN